jgi:hypothetical protein
MSVPSRLLICGIPGSGKTHFVEWLRALDWITVFNDHLGATSLERLWAERYQYDGFGQFERALSSVSSPVAIEYGFHASHWAQIEELQKRGFSAWWFDGDRTAAKLAWSDRRKTRQPDVVWEAWVAAIDQQAANLSRVFGNSVIRTVEADPRHGYRHMAPEDICQTIFGSSLPPR